MTTDHTDPLDTTDVDQVDLSIDKYQLDTELVNQPQLRLDWGRRLAAAQLAEDEAKSALSLVAAELDRQVRADPDEYGLTKVTEATVTAAVQESDEYQVAAGDCTQARYAVNMCRAVVEALEHRRSALTRLVELYFEEYFAEPRTPKGRGRRNGDQDTPAARAAGTRKRRGA